MFSYRSRPPTRHSPCAGKTRGGFCVGDLRNKAAKDARQAVIDDRNDRAQNGFTVFHFDLNPKLTRRDLSVGEALRHMMRVTGTKISTWRCPIRGLALEYHELPRTRMAHDHGTRYQILRFSTLEDEREAKRELAVDMLLQGIGLYRGFPNSYFKHQVGTLIELLEAPPTIRAEDWNKGKASLHKCFARVLETHQPELRHHLLGQVTEGLPTGTVAFQGPVYPGR